MHDIECRGITGPWVRITAADLEPVARRLGVDVGEILAEIDRGGTCELIRPPAPPFRSSASPLYVRRRRVAVDR